MTFTPPEERREHQRLGLTRPIEGAFGDKSVRVVDVSESGAQFESMWPFAAGAEATLRFPWRDEIVAVDAVVVRRDEHRVGVKFTHESEVLTRALIQAVEERLRAQRANAMGERDANVIDGEHTITAASESLITGLVSWTYRDGRWRRRAALIADQPDDGFTISAGEADDQVQLLCATYESGDDATRDLIRTMAQMSVNESTR